MEMLNYQKTGHIEQQEEFLQIDADRVMVNLPKEFRFPGMKTAEHGWMDAGDGQ
jgi:hypothetical protein